MCEAALLTEPMTLDAKEISARCDTAVITVGGAIPQLTGGLVAFVSVLAWPNFDKLSELEKNIKRKAIQVWGDDPAVALLDEVVRQRRMNGLLKLLFQRRDQLPLTIKERLEAARRRKQIADEPVV